MKKATIKEISQILTNVQHKDDPILIELYEDTRKGVQELLGKWERLKLKEEYDLQLFEQMTIYETKARSKGYKLIAGIDEVGRGPLAGPVVSAAVILPENCYIKGLNDSKQLTVKKREELYEIIMDKALAVGIGIITSEEIDRINIYEATKKSMLVAIQQLQKVPDYLLIDAMRLNSIYPEESIIKGDSNSVSIAAASIIAKVTRDKMMIEYHQQYPEYDFNHHMGYGTKAHIHALHTYGACPIHRYSFAPIKQLQS